MGRGINILGYDGIWEGAVNAPFRRSYFRLIREAGFNHVRINFFAFKHMDAEGRVNPNVLATLDNVIEQSIASGLIPVIDEHDVDACQRTPKTCGPRIKAFWSQISERYARRYQSAIFEILNEPGGNMNRAEWNALALEVLRIVRSKDFRRTVIISALNSDNPQNMQSVDLPADDRNIILTVHYYEPFLFTHQGAPWSSAEARKSEGTTWGTEADKQRVREDLAALNRWAKKQGRPLYLGEFGVYEKAGTAQRAEYVAFIARTAESMGWAWAYWQFDHDFAVFDTDRSTWVLPLLKALIPPKSSVRF